MNLKPYPQYKDSGIEWLGEVPEHWNIKKFKHYYSSSMGNTILREELSDEADTPVYSATEFVEILGYIDNPNVLLRKDDFIIPARGNSIGHVKLVEEECTCTQTTIYAKRLYLDRINPKFTYWYQVGLRKKLYEFDNTAIPQLTVKQVKENPILAPVKEEQQAISSFLDRETSRIDALIQKKERLIELLKEKRIALITQAVTKGLDPNVPMKDSGIECLGEVPEHWDIKKLKHVSTYMVSNVDKKTQEGETTIRLFNYTDVYNNEFLTNEMDLMVASAPPGQLDNFIVYTDDVLITKDSEDWKDIAKPALVKSTAPDILCGYHLAMIRPIRGISTGKFLFRALQSTLINQQFQIASNGVTRYGLPKSAIGESLITLPPIKEQQEIASHIDQETSKIDNLTSKIISSITLLREYRSSLINAAVTGKIDLREAL